MVRSDSATTSAITTTAATNTTTTTAAAADAAATTEIAEVIQHQQTTSPEGRIRLMLSNVLGRNVRMTLWSLRYLAGRSAVFACRNAVVSFHVIFAMTYIGPKLFHITLILGRNVQKTVTVRRITQ